MNMQSKKGYIIFLVVIFWEHCHLIDAFYRSTAMCAPKRISCLSKTVYRFCFSSGPETYLYGRVKYCPNGTECNEHVGKFACVKTTSTVTVITTNDIQQNEEITIFWTDVSNTESGDSTFHSETFSSSITTEPPTTVLTTFPFSTKTTIRATPTSTSKDPSHSLPSTTPIGSPSSSIILKPSSNIIESTTKKIKRRKKPTSNAPSNSSPVATKRKKPTKRTTLIPPYAPKPTANIKKSTTMNRPTKTSRKPSNKTKKKPLPSNPSTKPPNRNKTPQDSVSSATTTQLQETSHTLFSTESVGNPTLIETSTKYSLEPTTKSASSQISPPLTVVSDLRLQTTTTPLPCPYYWTRLLSENTTFTQENVRPTPPSSCTTTGRYPSQNCHEYFECFKVMWWYRLMIMKCKKGEGFDATSLKCLPDVTCV